MTLREKIFKTFVVTIREVNAHGGPKEFFEKYPVGGIYYGEGKVYTDENNLEMGMYLGFDRLQECKKYSKNKLLVCADEVNAIGQTVDFYPQSSLGATQSEEDAYNWGKVMGMQMNDKGIDWVLQPSIDMYMHHLMPLAAISNDPKLTARLYRKVVKGIQDQGVCATVKHFPGLGTSYLNMHIGPGQNTFSFDKWMDTYGFTYKEMFDEGVMSVMTTHATLKSYDNEITDGFYPIATYSKKLTTNLLKEELGFDGVVVTDALVMGGMATGDIVKETVQAFKAGADVLLWPPVEAAEAIEEAILSGEIPMSRLCDALSRIEKMEKFREENKNAASKSDSKFIDEFLTHMAEDGICLLRNEINLIPLDPKIKNVLIVDATDRDEISSKMLKEELEKRGMRVDVKREIYDVPSRVCWQGDTDKLQENYDLIILNLNEVDTSAWSISHMLIWNSHLFDKNKKLIVNYGTPFMAEDYFPQDPTIIEMNCNPNRVSISALADGILGRRAFLGKPVLKKDMPDLK